FIVLDKVIEKGDGWILFNTGGNIIRTIVDGSGWLENLFKSKKIAKVIHQDILPQDTALYSDVVLADCTYLEVYDLVRPVEYVPWGGFFTAVPAIDKPIADCLPYPIVLGLLAKDLGKAREYGETFARLIGLPQELWGKMADLYESLDRSYLTDVKKRIEFLGKIQELQIEAIAKKLGMSKQQLLEKLRTEGAVIYKTKEEVIKENLEALEKHELYTATGMLELFSVTLWAAAKILKNGEIKAEWHPIIDWVPPRALVEREKLGEDEFYLIYGKAPTMTHASTADNPILERLTREKYRRIWIHSSRAEKLGLKEGDLVEVCNSLGKCYKTRVHVTERIRPDTAFVVSAFGHESPAMRFAPNETVPYNKLVPPAADPAVGSAILGDTYIKIRKVGGA
ncbi:MAG: hypothetical protein LRS47_01455, partial [Desulfurococcales archaeon]|nr:hypothetical protein [Desulfurococcales archaeon]